jgi:hypothetical protein
MKRILYIKALLLCYILAACDKPSPTLFKLLPADKTGITFTNAIEESDTFNILTHEYIYNGGGVGVADFNNDGLQDVLFAGNVVPNRLYLNKGNLKFDDITSAAGINVSGRWNSGIAVVDINNDGWMDVYITATMKKDSMARRNMLFINKGLNKNGIPTFENQAAGYGIEDTGYSVASAFFDYDRDGDLDLYVLINQRLENLPTNYRPKMVHGESPNNDHLYRNNGDGTFTNVSTQAGISIEGFGLGLAISDFNTDGWPDIYVSNDYLSNDILYINNRDGTFQNRIAEFIGHQSQFSMGNDAADINNDGLPEIITLDMLPETNSRKKTTIGNKSYLNYINNQKFNYEYQYVRNMLHLNNGLNHGVQFSEIGQLSGIYQTEWSWSPLFADFDNDGNKDLVVTNGFPKDITDKDFANYRADVGNVASNTQLIDSIPVVKIQKYVFKNNGDLTFKDVTTDWGLNQPSFSNGAAFADLDNDGDLDYLVSNINDPAFIYENTLYSPGESEKSIKNNFLRVKIKGKAPNINGIGTKITLHYNHGKEQYYEHFIYRGFLSSVENIAHFGLSEIALIDSMVVAWPDGQFQLLKDVKVNQVVQLEYHPNYTPPATQINKPQSLLMDVTKNLGTIYRHEEEDKIDFNLQRTLPHKFTQAGPGICVGDINNDRLEDFIVGGSSDKPTTIFTQKSNGTFSQSNGLSYNNKSVDVEGMLLFDADDDLDNDLYVVSGSIESSDSVTYLDNLFLNDGKGKFLVSKDALPAMYSSGSCVRAADYDADGDLDLFVGGRIIPGKYPLPTKSYVLKNEKGKFTDVTNQVCPGLIKAGMITDALWSDFDADGKVDLIIVGEFMPITFYKNSGEHLVKVQNSGIDQFKGLWNSLTAGDYDLDGDIDYVVGNLGLNNGYQVSTNFPLKVFAKDFDGNGSVDPVIACFIRESMASNEKKLYPIHFWDELNSQSPKFRNKFSRYRQYGKSTIEQLLSPEDLKGALILEANHLATSYIENLGNGKFKLITLPTLVQIAPVNGMVSDDINGDGVTDILMIGNDYGNEVFTGRFDAFTGLILTGDGKGSFSVVPSEKSGFYVKHDAKALVRISRKKNDLYLATQNKDSLKVFARTTDVKSFTFAPEVNDIGAELLFENGRKERLEFYFGSGYLSQSSRKVRIPKGVKELTIINSAGKTRKAVLEVL